MQIPTREILIFFTQALYCYAIVTLIQKHFHLKTTRGLSDGLILGLLNAFMTTMVYVFCLRLPIIYHISIVIQTILMAIVVAQRFWYDSLTKKPLLDYVYAANILAAIAVVPVALTWPQQVGNTAGWLCLSLIFANRIPQIIKIKREKSVFGFSYQFILLLGIATSLEIVTALCYWHLPIQTLIVSIWAIALFFIFTWQFYKFSWKKPIRSC